MGTTAGTGQAARRRRRLAGAIALWAVALLAGVAAPPRAGAQPAAAGDGSVQLDFNDVELAVVIDTIARLTGRNFIYDDKVRGRVTVISPAPMTPEQAYAVFESILQVKGFTTVETPGGAVKVIPIRDAKESSVETLGARQETPNRDRFVTRLIPLRYIDAEDIASTLKPLASKEALLVAYAPTNTIILTDSSANIRRLLGIIDAIDVETHKEHLAVLKVQHADAASLGEQLSEIYGADDGAQVQARQTRRGRVVRRAQQQQQQDGGAGGGRVRILTDERTNSLIVLAPQARLDDIRDLVRRLDIPVSGGGRIHVHYLRFADAEELASTLENLLSGQSGGRAAGAAAGQGAQAALRAAVSELSEGVTVTADVATNSLVIQGSQEGYRTLATVIDKLDIPRPQVLVEALIMEVNVSDSDALGFNGIVRLVDNEKYDFTVSTATDQQSTSSLGTITDMATTAATAAGGAMGVPGFVTNLVRDGLRDGNGTFIQGVIRANASNGDTNIISAPHILTSDNQEAEINIGNNIPIITSRVQSAAGVDQAQDSLATSVNVERQEIGVTLRVTPQLTDGDSLRLQIFQEINNIDDALQGSVGSVEDVGPALTNRRVENTVMVADNETVVIGGLISDDYTDNVSKVPWLGDIPVLGWLFKTESRNLRKVNLLIFLTPHIIRKPADLEYETIRKREEFRQRSAEALELTEKEKEEDEALRAQAAAAGLPHEETPERRPVRYRIRGHSKRYPLERMQEIEREREETREAEREAAEAAARAPRYSVLAAVFGTEAAATTTLTELVDGGWDGFVVSERSNGSVHYRVLLGPYDTPEEARRVVDAVRAGFGLAPTVVVGTPLPERDGGGSASGNGAGAP